MRLVNVRLLMFAVFRDIVGSEEQLLNLPERATALDVWNELKSRHVGLAKYSVPPMTAINLEYVPIESALHDGDELAFIPPVSGGV